MTQTVHTGSAVVHTANLSLEFNTDDGPVHALSNIDLDIAPGEFISLIGPSGCGKTTLLRVIADLETHTGGEIEVNGVSPREARESRAYGYNLCVTVCPVENCLTLRRLENEVDVRTGQMVSPAEKLQWTRHPNNPMANADP